jgi:hypothetical protein
MNKKLLSTLITAGILVLPVIAMAQPVGQITSICQLITKIESIIWTVFGLIAVIAFVTAGILFLTAQGQPDKVTTARTAFIWGVVGVAVGILAYSIVAIVGSGLGVGVGSSC